MNCFQLFDKEGNSPTMQELDIDICKLLGEPVDPKYYCPVFKHPSLNISWYDTVGLALACGKSYDDIRNDFKNENVRKVVDFLESRYVPKAYYQPK